jgi:putative N6-adenine-specific DNA methylase
MTSRGLIDVLETELKELGFERTLKGQGGVFFEANWAGCYRANLRLRTATRVLLPILDFPAYNNDELYNNIRKHDFTKYIDPEGTVAVDSSVRECGAFRDQRFVSMKIKDAIVDQFRDKFEVRPDVDVARPDLPLVVRAVRNQFSVSLDTSGGPLFKRGYRVDTVEAPLKEHVAAGLLRLAEWDKQTPVVDPMCGSGTFLIEAALMALNIAPGTLRKGFGFQHWKNFQEAEWDQELEAAIADEVPELSFKFYGSDVSSKAVASARENVRAAGLEDYIEISKQAIETFEPPVSAGLLITNPPYGERLGEVEEAMETYKNLAYLLKSKFKGWPAYVLSGSPELSAAMKLKAERRFPIYNGPIECRLLKYTMF